jgi:deazaflavin-dependent oxidoreductase (nitroreductase family)
VAEREEYLYLTTTGRVSGRPREIEIWFVEAEGKFYILAEHRHKTKWVRNVLMNPRVHVRVGTRAFDATARVLDHEIDWQTYQRAQQLMRDKYDWGDGLPVEILPLG